MKLQDLIFFVLFFIANNSFGQIVDASTVDNTGHLKIKIVGHKNTKVYKKDGKVLTLNEIRNIMKTDSIAFKYYRGAQGQMITTQILSAAGGSLIGWPIGTAISGNEPEWGMLAGGIGLVLSSIQIYRSTNSKILLAVRRYNENLIAMDNSKGFEILFTGSQNGIGIGIRF